MNEKDGKAKVRKKNIAAKRKRIDEKFEKVERNIEDMANQTDQRVGHMLMDMITKFEGYKTICDIQMKNLMAKVEELKQLISQDKGMKKSTEPSIEFIVPQTSSLNASD